MWFIVRILIIVLSYSLEDTLLVHFARKYDGITTWMVRNITLIFSWLLLLFRVKEVDRSILTRHTHTIIITGILWMISVSANFEALRCLPVGIWVTYKRAVTIWASLLIWLIIFQETLNYNEWIALIVIIVWSLSLNFLHTSYVSNTIVYKKKKWILLMCIAWLATAGLRSTFKIFSHNVDPILSWYILEASIWVCMLILFIIRVAQWKQDVNLLFSKDTLYIWLISTLAYVGTIGTAIALKVWWIGLTQGLMTLIIPCSWLISRIIFREHLNIKQWIAICVVIFWIVLLQLT